MRVTVNPNDGTWVWADFGGTPENGQKTDGGGILHMVKRLGNVTSDKEAFEILEEIARKHGINVIKEEIKTNKKQSKDSGIVIEDVSMTFNRKALLNYGTQTRRIPKNTLEHYCRQVRLHYKSSPNKSYYFIGFPNNAGGYAMRGTGKNQKLNNIWGLSTISPDGTLMKNAATKSDKCAIFEGFMDFLSYLSWRNVKTPGMDICILHSASNTIHAKEWILSHKNVRTFFDNDEAGQKATDMIEKWCNENGIDFKDGRIAYANHNDINEAWKTVTESRKDKAFMAESKPESLTWNQTGQKI